MRKQQEELSEQVKAVKGIPPAAEIVNIIVCGKRGRNRCNKGKTRSQNRRTEEDQNGHNKEGQNERNKGKMRGQNEEEKKVPRAINKVKNRDRKEEPKKGHHVINNDTCRVFEKIIYDFLDLNVKNYFGRRLNGADLQNIVNQSDKLRKACEEPFSKKDMRAIERELIVYTPENEIHTDKNATTYGRAIDALRKDVVEYMTNLFVKMVESNGKMPSADPKFKDKVDDMNSKEMYVDHQALVWWLRRGRKATYERCRYQVAEMFRRLYSKEIVMWVSEFYRVYHSKKMNPKS